jgi:hypothetical protein
MTSSASKGSDSPTHQEILQGLRGRKACEQRTALLRAWHVEKSMVVSEPPAFQTFTDPAAMPQIYNTVRSWMSESSPSHRPPKSSHQRMKS